MNAAKVLTVLLAAFVSVGAQKNTPTEKTSAYIEFEHHGTQDGAWPTLIISTHPIPQVFPLYYNDVVDDDTYRRIGAAIERSDCTRRVGRPVGPPGTFLISEHRADGSEISWCLSSTETSEHLATDICRLYCSAGLKSKITDEWKDLLAIRADLQRC